MTEDIVKNKSKGSRFTYWLAVMAICSPILIGLVLWWVTSTALVNERKIDYAGICSSNLRQIGLAIDNYRQAHAGNAPPTLKVLVNEKQLTPECLRCPANQEEYIYRGGDVGKADNSALIVVYDRNPVHNGGRNILGNDVCVHFTKEKDFQERIANDNEIRKRFNLKSKPAE